jgi:predicted amidohydrolase
MGGKMKKFTICGIQIETGDDCRKNLEKSFSLCRSACIQHPDFIVLPEMFEIVPKPHRAAGYSHLIPSEITETLAGIAKEHSVNIIGGSFLENEGTRVYNTCCVFNRKGQLCGKYRKMHLFDAFGYNESTSISKGNRPLLCELDGLKFGVAICYDIRFPELFRHYALSGAHIVFVPSAFFQPNHDHWVLSIRSRALDNTIFVIGCNQTGKPFVGRSMVADPWGISASSMGVEEGIFTSLIDLDIIGKTREKLPLLANRRYDVSIRDSV